MGSNNGKFFDVSATSSLFSDFQTALEQFEADAVEVQSGLDNFTNSDDFRGSESEAAKVLTGVYETNILTLFKQLHSSIITLQSELLSKFSTDVDSASDAYISYDDLETINGTFQGYYSTYESNATSALNRANTVISKYSKYGSITKPDFSGGKNSYIALCGGDSSDSGYLYECMTKLVTFDESACQMIIDAKLVAQFVEISQKMGLYNGDEINYVYDEGSARKILDICQALVDSNDEDAYERALAESLLGVNPKGIVTAGDPINMSTGNFIYDHEDLSIPGEIRLSFHRFYNSLSKHSGVLGYNFTHNYEAKVELEDAFVKIHFGDGETHFFKRVDNNFVAVNAPLESLSFENEEYVLNMADKKTYLFAKDGKLVRIQNSNGLGISFHYDADNKLIQALSDNGASLNYFYDFDGRLIKVLDNIDRTVLVYYDKEFLSKVKVASGAEIEYSYGKDFGITEIVNSRAVSVVKNEYDIQNRVVCQNFVDGGEIILAYNDEANSVDMTERNGVKTTYVHDELGRNTEIIYFDGTKEVFEYNSRNQIVTSIDRNGNKTQFSYDNRGNITQVIEADGRKTNYTFDSNNNLISYAVNGQNIFKCTYDSRGNIIKSVNSLNAAVAVSHDDFGRPIRRLEPNGGVSEFVYDSKGNLAKIIDACGNLQTYEYDDANRVAKIVDSNGYASNYQYDNDNHITKVINALGNERIYEYNSSGKVVKCVDFDGLSTSAVYNELGKLQAYTDKAGNTVEYKYDLMWNVSELTSPSHATTKFIYDENNRLEKVVNPLGDSQLYSYDSVGNRVSVQDEENCITKYEYDSLNRLVAQIDPNGAKTVLVYDSFGNLSKIIDSKGNATSYEYDLMGQKTAEINCQGARTEFVYDLQGNVIKIIHPNGSLDVYEYDKLSRIISHTNADGSSVLIDYDPNGNVRKLSDRAGNSTKYEYDALNQVVAVTNALGGRRTFEYDAVGRVTSFTDENGGTTSYEYDANGNLIIVVDALLNKTEYEYDCNNNLIKTIVNGNETDDAQITVYDFDLLGNIVKIVNPLGDEEHFSYNKRGQLISKVDRDGFRTEYEYEKTGEVSSVCYQDGKSVKFAYNQLRQLEEITDWIGKTCIKVDELGRPLQVTDALGRTVGYEWGIMGEKTAVVYPDGKKTNYSYDSNLRLSAVETEGEVIKYNYDQNGNLSSKSVGDSIKTSFEYNAIGRISAIENMAGDIIERYSYGYDTFGNKISAVKKRDGILEDSGTFAYDYDGMNRLIKVSKDGNLLRSYDYDSFGNRTVMTDFEFEIPKTTQYRYNNNNQLIYTNCNEYTDTYQYDKRGNVSTIHRNNELLMEFSFDEIGYMSSVKNLVSGMSSDYRYNGLGKRVSKNVCSYDSYTKSLEYVVDLTQDHNNLLASYDTMSNAVRNFVYDANVVATAAGGELDFYLPDDLGSPMLFAGAGQIKSRYAFDEFGNNIIHAEDRFENTQPFGFTGYQADEVSGLYFAQARRYDSSTGRFVSEDIMRGDVIVPFTMNRYNYCWGRPMDFVDMNGMWPSWSDVKKAVSKGVSNVKSAAKAVGDFVEEHKATIATVAVCAVAVAGITAATVLTGGAAAPVLIGAAIGCGMGAGAEAVTEGLTQGWDNLDPEKIICAGATGAVSGALMGSNCGKVVATVGNGLVNAGGTLAGAMVDYSHGKDVNWIETAANMGFSFISGCVGGYIGGEGAQYGSYKATEIVNVIWNDMNPTKRLFYGSFETFNKVLTKNMVTSSAKTIGWFVPNYVITNFPDIAIDVNEFFENLGTCPAEDN